MIARLTLRYLCLISIGLLPIGQVLVLPAVAEARCAAARAPEELAAIAKTKGKAVRQQGRLTIKTAAGSIVFKDNCADAGESNVYHSLVAYFADVRYFLVHSVSIEYNEYTLINEKTAAKTTLYGVPVFSPDRQRFTAMVIDELNGLTSIEIYRLTSTGVKREYKNTQVKGPAQPVWKDNSTIQFQRTLMLGSEPVPAQLRRQNGAWKLI